MPSTLSIRSLSIIVVLTASIFSQQALAQVNVSVQATGKHKTALDIYKANKQKLKTLRKEARKKKKQAKALHKAAKDTSRRTVAQDTSAVISQLSTLDTAGRLEKARYYGMLADSLQQLGQTDSLAYHKLRFYEALAKDSVEFLQDSVNCYNDSSRSALLVAAMESWAAEYAMTGFPSELQTQEAFFDNPAPLLGEIPEIPQMDLPAEATFISPEEFSELLDQHPEEKVTRTIAQSTGLKKKFRSLKTSDDLSTGVKRNSLRDESFLKRLMPAGNINVPSTDPFILQADLQLGYRINRNLVAGVGFTMREQFKKADSIQSLTGDSFGYSVFASHDILEHRLFVYTEYQRLKSQSIFEETDTGLSHWNEAYYVGLGKEIKIYKRLKMTVMVLYDFNHKRNDLNARPLSFKVGYRL